MTSSPYGRAKAPWPNFGTAGGTSLHAEVVAGVAFLSNNLIGRWSGAQLVGGSASFDFEHNFGISFGSGELRVRIFEGGVELSEASVASSLTISDKLGDTTNAITVTNTTVALRTIEVYVEPKRRIRSDDLDADFSAKIKNLSTTAHNDTTTGTAATLSTATTSFKRLTGGSSLISVAGIPAPSPSESKILVLTNTSTTASVNILNNSASATAANRIRTGTGSTLVLAATASLILVYDTTTGTWRVVGGSGGGGFAVKATQQVSAGGRLSPSTDGFQRIRVEGISGAPVTTANDFMDAVPLDGTTFLLVGNSTTAPVTIPFSDTAEGFVGNGDLTLYKGSTALIQYDLGVQRYLEISRTIISLP